MKNFWLILAVSFIFWGPFMNRALFVDDHAHYLEALEIATHPLKPYTADSLKLQWKNGGSPAEANPPLYFYVVGALSKITGDSPLWIHVFLFPLHVAGLFAFFLLAKKFLTRPMLATVLWAATPHFWLTTNSLLLDSLMAPLFMIGLFFFIEGWEKNSNLKLIVGSLFLGMVPLVKYTGLMAPMAAVLWALFVTQEKKTYKWLYFAIPGLMFGLWIYWSHTLYQSDHFSAVAKSSMTWPNLLQILTAGAFSSGLTWVMLIPLALPFSLQSSSKFLFKMFLIASGIAVGLFLFKALPGGVSAGIQFGFWLAVFLIWLSFVQPEINRIDPTSLFLLSWIIIGLIGLIFARGWLCGRYWVILGPAMVLLTLRTLERKFPSVLESAKWTNAVACFLLMGGFLMAASDYEQANVDRTAAQKANEWIKAQAPGKKMFYASAQLSGLEYYLNEATWESAEPGQTMKKGDLLLLPARGLPWSFFPDLHNPIFLGQMEFAIHGPMRTLDLATYAGYYGSIWGPLPFSFSKGPAEVYTIVQEGN